MTSSFRLLVTGGGGSLGSQIRPHLRRANYRLTIFSLTPTEVAAEETLVVGDISDRDALIAALAGCDGVLHLAGCTTDAEWGEQIAGNVHGCIQVFEAARAVGIERVVFASSNHVVGMYPRTREVAIGDVLRPDSRYGVTKAFGELLGAYFADKHGMRVLCVRVGNVAPEPVDRRRLSLWISPRDMAQLVHLGLRDPDLHFRVVWGVSEVAPRFFEPGSAAALGFHPLDGVESHVDRVLAADPPPRGEALIAEIVQGGDFAASEFDGDAHRLLASFGCDV